jgi:hypothetical protein
MAKRAGRHGIVATGLATGHYAAFSGVLEGAVSDKAGFFLILVTNSNTVDAKKRENDIRNDIILLSFPVFFNSS